MAASLRESVAILEMTKKDAAGKKVTLYSGN
jgi:hypothetical protein